MIPIVSDADRLPFELFPGERMIVGIGSDLAEVDRIRQSIAHYGERFLNRIYTEAERSYSAQKANAAESLAARLPQKKPE